MMDLNIPIWEFALRAAVAVLCWVTGVTMAYGLARRWLQPRPLFVYMAVAVVLYAVTRTLVVWVATLTDDERDAVLVWLSPIVTLGGFVVVQSVLLMVIWRIREGRSIGRSTYDQRNAPSGTLREDR